MESLDNFYRTCHKIKKKRKSMMKDLSLHGKLRRKMCDTVRDTERVSIA